MFVQYQEQNKKKNNNDFVKFIMEVENLLGALGYP